MESTFTIGAKSQDFDTYDLCFQLKNDPLCPLTVYVVDGHGNTVTTYINQAYASGAAPYGTHNYANFQDALNKFMNAGEAYRTTSLSLTGVYVGPTLADQGSIVSAQMCDPAVDFAFCPSDSNAFVLKHVFLNGLPQSSDLILGTTPYVSNAREGFYVPYKMDDPDHWHRTDNISTMRRFEAYDDAITHFSIANSALSYPPGNITDEVGAPDRDGAWLRPLDNNVSITWVSGISKSASFRVTIRIGMEFMTRPSNTLASFCEPPALPDEHAIAMYREIASRMKDAYPSKDNDSGSLWDKIKNVASNIWDVVSPTLAATPLKPLVTGVNLARKAIPTISKIAEGAMTLKKEKKKGKQSKEAQQLASTAESAAERSVAGGQNSSQKGRGRRRRGAFKKQKLLDPRKARI